MKAELTCAIVRDLLPAYAEGLTCGETNEAVEAHLAVCPACAAQYAAMTAREDTAAQEEAREVDYLKKVRFRTRRRVALAVICTVLVLAAALAVKIFLVGDPLQPEMVSVTAQVEGDTLHLSVASLGSGNALRGWSVENVDGVVTVTARSVLVSLLFSDGTGAVDLPLEDVTEVWLGSGESQLVWQEDTVISRQAWDLWEARTPYVGDNSAVGRVMDTLNLWYDHAPYDWTMSLQTAAQPYGLTVHFNDAVAHIPGADEEIQQYMSRKAPVLLALIDNLEEVHWAYPNTDGVWQNHSMTLEEANDLTGVDVKSIDTPAALQQLLDSLA